MSKHLKDFHQSSNQPTPHPGVRADTRQEVAERLNEVAGKIARAEVLNDNDLNTLCEILYLADEGNAKGERIGRATC